MGHISSHMKGEPCLAAASTHPEEEAEAGQEAGPSAAQAPGPGRTLTCAAPRKASQEKPVLLGLARHPERAVLGKLAVALEVHEVYPELTGSWGRKAVRCQQRDPRPRAGRWGFRDGWRGCVDPASRVGTVTDDVCGCRTGRGNPLPRVLLP